MLKHEKFVKNFNYVKSLHNLTLGIIVVSKSHITLHSFSSAAVCENIIFEYVAFMTVTYALACT